MNTMYIVKAMRKNLAPKADYEVTLEWSNGKPQEFNTRKMAEKAAEDFQRDSSAQLYDARAISV